MLEWNGNLLWNRFVLPLKRLNHDSTEFLSPNVTCLYLRPRCSSAGGYQGPWSTRISGLLEQYLSASFRNRIESSSPLVKEAFNAKTSYLLTSIALQTKRN